MFFTQLPLDNLADIANHLSVQDFTNLSKTNKFLAKTLHDNRFWQNLFRVYYPHQINQLRELKVTRLDPLAYFNAFKACQTQPFFVNNQEITQQNNGRKWFFYNQLYLRMREGNLEKLQTLLVNHPEEKLDLEELWSLSNDIIYFGKPVFQWVNDNKAFLYELFIEGCKREESFDEALMKILKDLKNLPEQLSGYLSTLSNDSKTCNKLAELFKLAIQYNQLAIVEIILTNLTIKNSFLVQKNFFLCSLESKFARALIYGHLEMAKLLITHSIPLNQIDLLTAVEHGTIEIMSLFAKKTIDVNCVHANSHMYSLPLVEALRQNDKQKVIYLLDILEANPLIKANFENHKITILAWAKKARCNQELIGLLETAKKEQEFKQILKANHAEHCSVSEKASILLSWYVKQGITSGHKFNYKQQAKNILNSIRQQQNQNGLMQTNFDEMLEKSFQPAQKITIFSSTKSYKEINPQGHFSALTGFIQKQIAKEEQLHADNKPDNSL